MLETVYARIVFILYAQDDQGNQNLALLNPEIEAAARHRCSEARRKKEAAARMAKWKIVDSVLMNIRF